MGSSNCSERKKGRKMVRANLKLLEKYMSNILRKKRTSPDNEQRSIILAMRFLSPKRASSAPGPIQTESDFEALLRFNACAQSVDGMSLQEMLLVS